jgi:iron complex outermembrane receptor protein
MKLPHRIPAFLRAYLTLISLAAAITSLRAQNVTVGTIEGRVFNPGTGEYLENARITIEGTTLETFTDSSGQYRLTNVPAGVARVKAFRTGVVAQTQPVTLAAGQTAQQNFDLSGFQPPPAADGTVKLEKFVVGTSKEMDGSAIAINTQRFAPNVMNVVSADEYSAMTEGGIGELLKAVPGMAVNIGPVPCPSASTASASPTPPPARRARSASSSSP